MQRKPPCYNSERFFFFFFFSFHGTFATTRVKIYVLYKKKGGNLFFLYIFISKIWEISCSCSQEFCDICALFPNSFSLFSFLSRFYFLSLSSSPPLQYEENKAAKRPRKEKKKKKRDRTFQLGSFRFLAALWCAHYYYDDDIYELSVKPCSHFHSAISHIGTCRERERAFVFHTRERYKP